MILCFSHDCWGMERMNNTGNNTLLFTFLFFLIHRDIRDFACCCLPWRDLGSCSFIFRFASFYSFLLFFMRLCKTWPEDNHIFLFSKISPSSRDHPHLLIALQPWTFPFLYDGLYTAWLALFTSLCLSLSIRNCCVYCKPLIFACIFVFSFPFWH